MAVQESGDPRRGPTHSSITTGNDSPLRYSPPYQNGERRNPIQLPSFSTLLQAVEPSPPNTPTQTRASMESSLIGRSMPKPPFDGLLWTVDPKRRMVDRASENGLDRLPNDSSSSSSSGQSSLHSFHHRPNFGHAPSSMLSYSRQPSPTIYQRQPLLQQRLLGAPYGPLSLPPPGYVGEGLVPHRQGFSYEDPQQYDRNTARHNTHRQGDDRRYSLMPDQRHLPDPGFCRHQNYNQYMFQSSSGVNEFQRKRRGNLPKEATSQLKAWFDANRDSPYPSEDEKYALCSSTGLTLNQVSNWFINARRRNPAGENHQRDGRQ